MKRAIAILIIGAIAAVAASAANAYDRNPIPVRGLNSDGWGATTTQAEQGLYARYHGIRDVTCRGLILNGNTYTSAAVHGTTRYWDKLGCFGHLNRGTEFSLVFDQKSGYRWTIFWLYPPA